jgi:hypothetical protein
MASATSSFFLSYSSGPRPCQASIQSGVKAWTMWRPSGASEGSSLQREGIRDGQQQGQHVSR